jgi:hypothetical protein
MPGLLCGARATDTQLWSALLRNGKVCAYDPMPQAAFSLLEHVAESLLPDVARSASWRHCKFISKVGTFAFAFLPALFLYQLYLRHPGHVVLLG